MNIQGNQLIKIDIGTEELKQLVMLGLDSDESPVKIADGYEAADLKIKQGGGASFELTESDEDDSQDDGFN